MEIDSSKQQACSSTLRVIADVVAEGWSCGGAGLDADLVDADLVAGGCEEWMAGGEVDADVVAAGKGDGVKMSGWRRQNGCRCSGWLTKEWMAGRKDEG